MSHIPSSLALPEGLWVLTASQRQKRSLTEQLTRAAVRDGAIAMRPPQVATLEEFLQSWLDRQRFSGILPASLQCALLLSARQQEWLWQRAIAEVGVDAPLLHGEGLAALAQTAAELVSAWQLQVPAVFETHEYRAFVRWSARFHELAASLTPGVVWMSPGDLLSAIIAALPSTHTSWPQRLALFGFEELTPQQEALIAAWRGIGVDVETWQPQVPPLAEVTRTGYVDTRSELYAAACWARDAMAAGKTQLTVVVPRLAALRPLVEEVFDAVLHPQARYAAAPGGRDYNLSLGLPLARQPLVATALALLRITYSPVAVEQPLFWSLLRSPYWSAALDESAGRARLEAVVRERLPLSVFLTQLKAHADRQDLPQLGAHLTTMMRLRTESYQRPGRQPPSAWAEVFLRTLNEIGWPGQRPLSSAEHQAREALQTLLVQELPAIEALGAQLDVSAALAELSLAAERQLFQAQTEGTPRLQILGLFEAIGSSSEALWVTGMDDTTLPAPARPHPLLPTVVQRTARIPHASAERELQFSRQILEHLQRCAPTLVFSYPLRDGDQALRPCPLIAAHREQPAAPLAPYFPVQVTTLESLRDERGPAVPADEVLSGGTDLLKSQAICPLWSFVRYRLGAAPLAHPVDELAATDLGNIYHLALQAFWDATRTHAGLLDLIAKDTLVPAVDVAVQAAFAQAGRGRPLPLGPVLQDCLQEKVSADLLDWLQIHEAARQPFAVYALEEKREIEIAGVRIKTRADRIDRLLPDVGLVVIDYKTGAVDRWRSWRESRISEPQVPLYGVGLVAAGERVSGAALAGLRRNKGVLDGFRGVTEGDAVLPQVLSLAADHAARAPVFSAALHPDWQALLAAWQEALASLAREIREGEASLRVRRLSDLEYCPVKPVLRLAELQEFLSEYDEAQRS